ncbi:MAG: Rpn family recombination-promoting nuclease/putative transposase [Planctomycetes bacterium]|nr:Rpn family recombination-promoting nuclease/putative transposase [Planctomycetota bacterium]
MNHARELPEARGFFRGYLPAKVARLFDWTSLRLESESFFKDDLAREFADLLFSVRLVGDTLQRRIRLLFEHKSRPVASTPRQLHRYISRQLEATPPDRPLPCILTVVLLQSGRWRRSPSLSSEYELPEAAGKILAPYVLDFRMLMVELSELDEADLRGTEAGRLGLALLKTIGEGQPLRWLRFRGVLRELCSHLPPDALRRELRRAIYYVTSAIGPEKEPEVRRALSSATAEFEPVKETAMTLLEHLEKRGEKRGKKLGEKIGEKRGEREGRLGTLLRLLSAAFPDLTQADAASVRELTDAALDELTDALAQRRPWREIRNLWRGKHPNSSRPDRENAAGRRSWRGR